MQKEVKILSIIVIIVFIAAIVGANYYRNSIQSERKPTTTANSSLIREDSPTLGAADAPVTIVEFLDPECESCRAFNPTVKKILKEYDGKVRLVVRYMPLHPNSLLAATYTEAAGEQGKYWQMQEILFQRQSEWGTRHGPPQTTSQPPNVPALFEKYAMELGLDVEKINSAVRSNRYGAKLERDKKDGQSLGVRQTPTFFVNGRQLARLYEADLKSLINEELKK
jgi:protein-disulfide isomerase